MASQPKGRSHDHKTQVGHNQTFTGVGNSPRAGKARSGHTHRKAHRI